MGQDQVKLSIGSRLSDDLSMGIRAFAVSSALCS